MRLLPRASGLVLSALLAACGSTPPPPAPAPAPSEADRLEKEGITACEEGTQKIRVASSWAEGKSLSGPEEDRLKGDLQDGLKLITSGMERLDRCNQMTGRTFDLRPYTQAAKAARMKLAELK
jgi:hypothetical protein